jgi:hypothetical protein
MASNLVNIIPNTTKALFGLLTSSMHMAWMRTVGSRFGVGDGYRYSLGTVYNTFPAPAISAQDETKLEALADSVLAARDNYPDDSLAELYDPNLMPPDLRKAHQALDRFVDSLYRPGGFSSEQERVEHLLGRYAAMIQATQSSAPTTKAKKKKP